jgi:hypothetical protein
MSKAFSSVLARRFAPLNFSAVPGFPHPVPHMSEWGDFLPIFRERKEDNPTDHLIKFHECMDQLDLHHEDVCMNMFMHSLDGDARQWYFSLPPSNISSLKDFHTVFKKHCKRYFSDEFLFEYCCEKYELHDEIGDIDREEIVPHNLHQFYNALQDDMFSHKHEIEMNNEEAESFPATIIFDCYKYEDLIALAIKHEDQLVFWSNST